MMQKPIDYQELIDELKDEVGAGSLQDDEVIQILRDKNADEGGYRPIVDWYYSKQTMEIELTSTDSDDEDDLKEAALLKEQYQKDLPELTEMTVDACLKEMFERSTAPKKSKRGKHPFF